MEALIKKYENKLIQSGLGARSGLCRPIVGGLEDTLIWNRKSNETEILEKVVNGLNINSLVFLRPVEPYAGIITWLTHQAMKQNNLIEPKDCETRTFLHDLPVINNFDADQIITVLKKRKSVIIAQHQNDSNDFTQPAIIAHGTVSPEQGFVTISSVCFASFVKFFADYLENLQTGTASREENEIFDRIQPDIPPLKQECPEFIYSPFENEETVYAAIIEAGKRVVEYGLVDSYFGNVSYLWKDTLYISQTASSLDELAGCIDPIPLDNSTSAGLTASSELTAHLKAIEKTGCRAILHGHPHFCVILSMDCDPDQKKNCKHKTQCHVKCPEKRFLNDKIPIVPGEVGTGATGLCNTLPDALKNSESAIVYGHGLFTTGTTGFSDAFKTMLKVEELCQKTYFEKVEYFRKAGTSP